MKPIKPIHDPTFRYVPSVATDIRKTFSRIEAQSRVPDHIKSRHNPYDLNHVAKRRAA